VKLVSLSQVSKINPRFLNEENLTKDAFASFVPMAFVSEKTKSIVNEEERKLGDVIKGFTYFENDDVLLAKITPCFENGKIALAKINNKIGFGSTEFHVVRAHKDKLDSKYLFHFLRRNNILFEGEKRMTGSAGQKRVPKAFLENLQIPLPPLPEQKRIAEVLDKADALREKRRLALQKLDTLLQSVFLEMFGDPVKNPKGLETIYLEKGIALKGGFAFKSGDYVKDGIPLIRIGEANRGKVDSNNAKFLPTDFLKSHSKFVLKPGDLLMSLTGTTGKDDYANVAILGNEFEYYFLNQRVSQFLMKDDFFTKEYIYQLLKDAQIKAQITGKSRGIRQANISNNDILKLKVSKPPIELQEKFSAAFHKIKALTHKYKLEEKYLEALFQSLQQRAFKGELFNDKFTSAQPQEENVWQQTSLF